MTLSPRPLAVAVALLALFLAGCGTTDGGHDDADVAFATGMVPHHQQAVEMSDLLLTKTGVDADVRDLATQIRSEQAPEIAQMSGWLRDWDAPVPAGTGMEGMGTGASGDGMMSQTEMDALTHAEGRTAQTLFLQGMVGHHEGAVAMAKTELDQGENTRAKILASSIVASQQAEIDRMNRLLAG